MTETKRKKKKKGRVVRLSDFAFSVITDNKESKQSLREAIDLMIADYYEIVKHNEGDRLMFALVSDLYKTIKEARGAAILRSVKSKSKDIEEVIEVKVRE